MADKGNALLKLLDEEAFKSELRQFLENAIDEELAKPDSETDCELIDECVNLLLETDKKTDANALILGLASSGKIISLCEEKAKRAKLRKGIAVAVAASVALITVFGTNAAIERDSGVNYLSEIGSAITAKLEQWGIIRGENGLPEQPENTVSSENESAAVTQENTENSDNTEADKTTSTITDAPKKAPDDEKIEPVPSGAGAIVALRLSFTGSFKTEYLWGEELDLSGISVHAVFDDGTEKEISIHDCTVTGYNKALTGSQKILVKYKGVGVTFDVSVVKTNGKGERTITGVDGTPPEKTVYTTDDRSLDLKGLRVRFIYSDGTFSSYYNESSVSLVKGADFTKPGKQTVTVRVAQQADFSYEVVVEQAKIKDEDIERIEFACDTPSVVFNVGDNIFHSDCYINVYYKSSSSSSSKVEKVYFKGNERLISVYNLDTSTDTSKEKTFTIGYKGFFTTQKYIVSYRRHVRSVRISEGEFKRLYYKGEPLCYNVKGSTDEMLKKLASYNQDFSTQTNPDVCQLLFRGSSPKLEIEYIESSKQTVKYSACSFYGYDPYREGYQKIDVYYNDTYLMSYIVFVYSNSGYVPISIANYELIGGKDLTKGSITVYNPYTNVTRNYTGINYLLKAEGDGKVGNQTYSCTRYIANPGKYGKQTAYVEAPDGTVYSYEVKNLRQVVRAEIRTGNSGLWKIKLSNLDRHDYGSDSLILTFADNSIETVPLNKAKKYCSYIPSSSDSASSRPITQMSDINGAFGIICFAADNDNYSFVTAEKTVYFYRDGYENSIRLTAVSKSNNTEEFFISSSYTKSSFINSVDFVLTAPDSSVEINSSAIGIEGVSWGVEGVYNAKITAVYMNKVYEMDAVIHIGK